MTSPAFYLEGGNFLQPFTSPAIQIQETAIYTLIFYFYPVIMDGTMEISIVIQGLCGNRIRNSN